MSDKPNIPYKKLINRRQYLIAPIELNIEGDFAQLKIKTDFILHYHSDLPVEYSTDKKIVLLGDAFDLENPDYYNSDIIEKIKKSDPVNIENYITYLSGRFILIINLSYGIRIYHDPFAARKIYYSFLKDGFWLGSQSHLIANYANLKLTKNNSLTEYYKSDTYKSKDFSDIRDLTCYDEIKQLIPNFYLDIKNNKAVRYWPVERIVSKKTDDVVADSCLILKKTFEAYLNRYKIMMPVTAGVDSRTLLAASLDYKNKIKYYINNYNQNLNDPDFQVSRLLSKKMDFKFDILDIKPGLSHNDKEYIEIYHKNNPHPSEKYMDIIYNYLLHYSEYVNVTGNFAGTAKAHYELPKGSINGKMLAKKSGFIQFKFIHKLYQEWIDNTTKLCADMNIPILDLFYWEERAANWGSQIQIDKDIAQEDYCPYNSRLLMELLLSIKRMKRKKPLYILQKEIVRFMNEKAVKPDFNPTRKNRYYILLYKLGIFKITQDTFRYLKNKI